MLIRHDQGTIIPDKEHNHNKTAHECVLNSVLASGTWYKMEVTKEGIYKITYNDLVNLGINVSSIDPQEYSCL